MTKHIETQRLVLREWTEDDTDPFIRINNDPLIMEYFPRRLDEASTQRLVKRFQAHFKKHGYGFYALELKDTGEFIGFVGIGQVDIDVPFKPAVEIAWRLDYAHWGKGYATEAARAVLAHAFGELGLNEVVAFTVHDNSRSIHVMEKLGMSHDKKGDFRYPGLSKESPVGDYVLYRLKKSSFMKKEKAA